ncbi:MAG: hypothetical protein ABSG91_00380 [Syntrophobacteraceae bacterium]
MPGDPEKAFISDMKGIFGQHSQLWTVTVETIKILVTVSALPILAVGISIGAAKHDVEISNLPSVVIMTLFFTPMVDLVIVSLIMRHRFEMLFYARALNKYRAIYSDWAQAAGIPPLDLRPMPVDHRLPRNYEPAGPAGLIVHGTGVVNGLYPGLGMYSVHAGSFGVSLVTGLAYLKITYS